MIEFVFCHCYYISYVSLRLINILFFHLQPAKLEVFLSSKEKILEKITFFLVFFNKNVIFYTDTTIYIYKIKILSLCNWLNITKRNQLLQTEKIV